MALTLREAGEGALIALARELLAPNQSVLLGIGDDGAIVRPGRAYGVQSPNVIAVADAMIEGVHFERTWSPADAVGHKLVNVNVSDVAAMGGRPEWALLTCSFPANLPLDWVRQLLQGVGQACQAHGLAVVGGDMTGSRGPIALSLSVCGVPGARVLRRSGARAGDGVFITGELGGAALGLRALMSGTPAPGQVPVSVARQLRPTARVAEGCALADHMLVGACMDLSDGLGTDAERLARASAVRLELDLDALPLCSELLALDTNDALELATFGGEDYELLFTCLGEPPIAARRVGTVVHGAGLALRWRGEPWHAPAAGRGRAFDHFSA